MKIWKYKISKKFALKASLWRRIAKSHTNSHTFSYHDLLELYDKESRGIGRSFDSMKEDNGFAYGKWLRDLALVMMVEDVQSGDFAKIEFIDTTIQRIHNWPILEHVIVGRFTLTKD